MVVRFENNSDNEEEEEQEQESGERKLKGPDLSDLTFIRTYYWFLDLQGKLKQELHPPGEYHGHPRMYIREDIVRDEKDPSLITSHLRVYAGKHNLLAYTTRTVPEYITRGKVHESDVRHDMKMFALSVLLNKGWKDYALDNLLINRADRKKSSKSKPKQRKPAKNTVKKPRKKVVLRKSKTSKRK